MLFSKLTKLLKVDYKDWEQEEGVTEKGTRLITVKKDERKVELMVYDEDTVIQIPDES